MTALRDAFAADVLLSYDEDSVNFDLAIADAILGSPEMEQIRQALRTLASKADHEYTLKARLIRSGLSEAVVDWVLS